MERLLLFLLKVIRLPHELSSRILTHWVWVDRAKVINTTVANWLKTRDLTDEFDLIFADPPYNRPQFSTVFGLAEALKSKGLMILSMSSKRCESEPNKGVVVVDDFRSYGEATLAFYSKL